MFEFKVDNRSGFWGVDNKKVMRGSWKPTHYTYWVDSNNGYQWLVVGNCSEVEINGRKYSLMAVPEGCNIKGMEDLDGPCWARKHYKTIRVSKEEPQNEEYNDWVDSQHYW